MQGAGTCSLPSVRLRASVMRDGLVQDVVEIGDLLSFLICLKFDLEKVITYLSQDFFILIREESYSKKVSTQAVVLSGLITLRPSHRAHAGVKIYLNIDDLSEDRPGKARQRLAQQKDPREVPARPLRILQLVGAFQHAAPRQQRRPNKGQTLRPASNMS